jgi:hypothetical protein
MGSRNSINAQAAGQSGAPGQSNHAAEATLMRYRLSRAWALDHGRVLAPSGTVIDSNSDDDWSRLARKLTPPWDVQALDDECYQLLLRAYPRHRHLIGPPPPGEQTNN